MKGLGGTIEGWAAVRRLVIPFARWPNYERSGMGRSESPLVAPESTSAVSVAAKLMLELSPPTLLSAILWEGPRHGNFCISDQRMLLE